jgi:adenosylcobinamide-GDP ribazoletransferase
MQHEIRIFFTAIMFYTRIPCPQWVNHREEYINQATRYFPLIGWIVGLIAGLVYLTGSYLFGTNIGLTFSMAASVLTTGAFHEDGFADVCDGFGGGWTKERILEIMKDSRVGTYGVVGILLLFALKFFSLHQLLVSINDYPYLVMLIFVTAHSLSRFIASTFIFTHQYVRDTPDSKAKPVAKTVNHVNLVVAALFAFLPLLAVSWMGHTPAFLLIIFPAYLSKVYLSHYFTKWIGGYTGDCLGATQQVAEVMVYLSFILIWKFI